MEPIVSLEDVFPEIKFEIVDFISKIKNSHNLSNLLDKTDFDRLSYQYSILHFLVNNFSEFFNDYLIFFKHNNVNEFLKEKYEPIRKWSNYETETGFRTHTNIISELQNEIKDKLALIWLKITQYKTFKISIIETLEKEEQETNKLLFSIQNIREQLSNQLKELETLLTVRKYSDCFIKAEGFLKSCIKSIAGELNIEIDKINKKTKKDDYIKLLNDIFSTIMSTQNKSVENIFGFIKTSFGQIILPVRNFFKTENYDKKEVKEFNQRSANEQNLYCRFYIDLCKLISNVLLVISNKESS